MTKNIGSKSIDLSSVKASSSLAHLAYGDLAFKAWRDQKKALKINDSKK